MSEVTSERECLQSNLTAATEELSVLRSEWSTAQSDLATLQTQVGGAQRVAEVAEKEVGSLREELAREKDSHSSTRQRLAAAVKVGTLSLPLFPFTLFTLSSSLYWQAKSATYLSPCSLHLPHLHCKTGKSHINRRIRCNQ